LQLGQGLRVEQCHKGEQCIDRDFGSVRFPQTVTDDRVEHPTRHG
jgi:hypothetical protein